MRKTAIIFAALILLSFLFTSCQKAKETEAKKEVQAQREEVKQEPSETKPPETKAEIQSEPSPQELKKEEGKGTPSTTTPVKEITKFKEPVLLWEREFDPPIREISDQNSNGDFLAIQVKTEEGSGRPLMQKLLVIDSKGKTKKEELLPKKKSITIPADQLWLTASSDDELAKLRKAKKPQQVTAWGKEMYIAGNGEYYATVIQYGGWYEFEYKDKNGKTLWKINPKDNYGFEKAYISYDGSRIVIIDMGGLGGGDVWEVLGQRVYFYDNTGKLLKDYDWGEGTDDWLSPESISISKNSQYIGGLKGYATSIPINDEHSILLFDGDGKLLYSKKIWKRHSLQGITNNGDLLTYNSDIVNNKREIYLFNKNGVPTWNGLSFFKEKTRHVITSFGVSNSAKYILADVNYAEPVEGGRFIDTDVLSVIEAHTKRTLFEINISDLCGDKDIVRGGFGDILEDKDTYLFIYGHSRGTPEKYCNILFDLKNHKILLKKEKSLGRFANEGKLTKGWGSKVFIYSLGGE